MSRSLEDFYENKSVLVTGHTGFKGGWLTTWLRLMGSRVAGYALAPQQGRKSFYTSAHIGEGIHSHFGDVRDFGSLLKFFRKHKPEIVFHNAAQALVRASYADPVATYHTNVLGTVHVLEAARLTRCVKALVIVTSDKCYENREWIWGYREQDALGGHDPYSSSKACAELATAAYRASFFGDDSGVGVASARAGNVIGGGDWADDRIIPDIMRAILARTSVKIRHPHATRPWQHVLDPVRGYLSLARHLAANGAEFAGAWNFGPPTTESLSVGRLAEQFAKLWGGVKLDLAKESSKVHEAQSLKLDSSKARRYLGWQPLLDVEEALRFTFEWYRAAQDPRVGAERITRRQLADYMALC